MHLCTELGRRDDAQDFMTKLRKAEKAAQAEATAMATHQMQRSMAEQGQGGGMMSQGQGGGMMGDMNEDMTVRGGPGAEGRGGWALGVLGDGECVWGGTMGWWCMRVGCGEED